MLDLEQSQEAYRIRSNRFTQGLEKTTDLLESETQMFKRNLIIYKPFWIQLHTGILEVFNEVKKSQPDRCLENIFYIAKWGYFKVEL
jgi:hypothetical protein